MAAETAMTNRHIVSNILHHLSDMKYKDRRQYGPDQPVEFLEFRPTLVPSILVNRLWADAGTSLLWRRYPHLPALKDMPIERRQYYADKVQCAFALSPPLGNADSPDYMLGLAWPQLKSVELEIDVMRHGSQFASMLHDGLDDLEISGHQSGGSSYFSEVVLPTLLVCQPSMACDRIDVYRALARTSRASVSAWTPFLTKTPYTQAHYLNIWMHVLP
jgi:hypothetical protein